MDQSTPRIDPPQPPLRALVVDDRDDVAMSLAMLLKHLGHTVEVAFNAHEALQKVQDFTPDVIFLDIGLPDLSGHDVCKEIRDSELGLKPYIVAVTGRDEAEDLLRAAHTGFDRHVGKPMPIDTLKEILHTVQMRALFPGLDPASAVEPGAQI